MSKEPNVLSQIILPGELLAPTDSQRLRKYRLGKAVETCGRTLPLPFFRPALRYVGKRLWHKNADKALDVKVQLGEWKHLAIYQTLSIHDYGEFGSDYVPARAGRLRTLWRDLLDSIPDHVYFVWAAKWSRAANLFYKYVW